jgi:hypothetical protein
MSVTFDLYRIAQDGQRELVQTTRSAREAREVRDASQDEILVFVHDDATGDDQQSNLQSEVDDDIEGDFLI